MPTNVKHRKVQARSASVNLAISEYLLTGHWWGFLAPRGEDPRKPDEEYLRGVWARNRAAIVERYPDAWAVRRYDLGEEEDRSASSWAGWIRTDLDRAAAAAGYYFDAHAADRAVKFFERFLRHSKGRWQGKPFRLSAWQRDRLIMPAYGWMRPDGTRRYRTVFEFIPKKNGKSTMSSGLTLYHLIGEGEPSAEVYCGAADRNQASIVFNESVSMVMASPVLSQRLTIVDSRKFIYDMRSRSLYHAMSADAYRQEGLNISACVIDELHVHPSAELLDTIRYGGAARTQPITWILTTAGEERRGPWWEELKYARQVQEGKVEDLEYLPLLFCADELRDKEDPKYWTMPECWYAANPSLGDTLSEEDMRQDCLKAQNNPRLQIKFKRYRLNLPGYRDAKWIPPDRWRSCAGDGRYLPLGYAPQAEYVIPPALAELECNAGLDLSSTTDLSAFVLDFPIYDDEGERMLHVWVPYLFTPEETARERAARDRRPYLQWARDGYMELTPGSTIDYDYIHQRILQIAGQVRLQLIAVDRWNSTQLQSQLQDDGLEILQFGQGFASMSAPCKLLETLVHNAGIIHGNHPALADAAENIVIRTDAADNCKPDKEKSTERIDAMVAGVMALDCSHRTAEAPNVFDGNLVVV